MRVSLLTLRLGLRLRLRLMLEKEGQGNKVVLDHGRLCSGQFNKREKVSDTRCEQSAQL